MVEGRPIIFSNTFWIWISYLFVSKIFFIIFDFRVFYSDHLMQSLVHLITTLSDVREFNKTNHGLIFANTLHHAQNRGFLWTLFWMKNLVRVVLVIVALSVTAHFHLTDLSVSNGAANHSKSKEFNIEAKAFLKSHMIS